MGSVYILTNKGMPNLVKIGYTERTAEDRANELYEKITGVPMPFNVAHEEICENPQELETLIHKELDDLRPNKYREFFEFSEPSKAIQKIKEIHKRHPTHVTCVGSQYQENLVGPADDVPQTPRALDDGVWRKWTSHFLTRFKRKTNTQ